MAMETTIDVILDYLRRNNFSIAESVLREELIAMKIKEASMTHQIVDELPRLPPVRIQFDNKNNGLDGSNSSTSFDSGVFLSMGNTPEGFFTFMDFQDLSGVKNLCGRPSASDEHFEDHLSDQLSGFVTAKGDGDCASEFAIDYPCQHWDDSDTYENDDDPGYHRQPIEDKVWFLTHEIEHPSSDDEQGKLQSGWSVNESIGNLDEDIKSVVKEETCFLADEMKLRNLQDEKVPPCPNGSLAALDNNNLKSHGGESINSEALDLLNTSYKWQYARMEMEVKFDNVWDESGRDRYRCSMENDTTFLASATPDGISGNSEVVVSRNVFTGMKINGYSRRRDLGVEESMQDSYFQRSNFEEHSNTSGIRHVDSEDETDRHFEEDYENQQRHHVYYNRSSRQSLELQLTEQEYHKERSPLVGLNSSDHECKSDESPHSSSTRSQEILAMDLFEPSNLSCQTNNDDLLMETKGEGEDHVFKETDYAEYAVEEDEALEAMQGQVQGSEEDEYEEFDLKIIHRKNRTGFEEDKDLDIMINSVIAGRYHVSEYLGSAAFSKAIQAHDLHTGMDVCMKIIKNNKDFFDQSLDEIKLLKYVNMNDPADRFHILRLYDYFYHKEHLFIVCELLRANLYEFQKFNNESGGDIYFTMPRIQYIARQILEALDFLHGLRLIHCDLKPENILVKSYSRCEIKVIDLGSSCFQTDHLCSYVQSRAYRAPEVILGLPYDQKIDIWSLGCILAELCSGNVLFQNDSVATLLARIIGILGPIDPEMLAKGQDTHQYFTKNHVLYERIEETERLEYIIPKKTSLSHRLPMGDVSFVEFVAYLLQINPAHRPTAKEALEHPWMSYPYEPISS